MNIKIKNAFRTVLLAFFGLSLSAVMIPRECSREEAKYLEQFQYITRQPGYQKPKGGEVTFYQTNGPIAGGSVSALIHEDHVVYAGIFGDGVYRKNPEDDLWEPLSKGIRDPFLLSLSRSKDGIFLAGTIKGGIFRSVDKGKTWLPSNLGLTNFEIATIAEYHGEYFIGTGSGVFRSSDQGLSWEALNKGMESTLVKAFLIDRSGTYFAGTGGQGIFRSMDKGKKWDRVEFKLEGESGLNENYIRVIIQSPKKFLYAGTFGGGIFRSTDGGRRWIPVNSGLKNSSIRTLVISPDGNLITGTGEGIFVSSNEGENWKSVNGDLTDKNVQSMMLAFDQLYIGTASAVYRKPMNETHWTQLDKGITFPSVSSLTGDPERGFYAGTDGEGIYRSKDGGFSWFPMNEGLADLNVRSMVEDASHTLFILTEGGVYKGDRAKKSWVLMKEGIGIKGIHALYLDSENILYSGTEDGLFKRDRAAQYWEKIILPIDRAIKWIAGGKERLFAISDQEIFYIKKGESNPVPIRFPELQGNIRGAFFNDYLYIWTGKSIFEGKFEKQDLFWKALPGLPDGLICQTLDVETLNGNRVIFIGTDKGVFWSENSGTIWHPAIGKGALVDAKSFFSPYPGTLLLGTGDRGVWVGIGL